MFSASNRSFDQFSPNYSVIYKFEQQFDYNQAKKWMENNWNTAFYWIAWYLVIVFGGQKWMSNRQAYKLKPLLVVWNVLLATFSIAGTIRTLPQLIHVLSTSGFSHSVSLSNLLFDFNKI